MVEPRFENYMTDVPLIQLHMTRGTFAQIDALSKRQHIPRTKICKAIIDQYFAEHPEKIEE